MIYQSVDVFEPLSKAVSKNKLVKGYSNFTFLDGGICYVFNGHFFVGVRGDWCVPCSVEGESMQSALSAFEGSELDVKVVGKKLQFYNKKMHVSVPVLPNVEIPQEYRAMELLKEPDKLSSVLSSYSRITLTPALVEALSTAAEVGRGNENLPHRSGVDMLVWPNKVQVYVLSEQLTILLRAKVTLGRARKGQSQESPRMVNLPVTFLEVAMALIKKKPDVEADLWLAAEGESAVITVKGDGLTVFETPLSSFERDLTSRWEGYDKQLCLPEDSAVEWVVTPDQKQAFQSMTLFDKGLGTREQPKTDLYLVKDGLRVEHHSKAGESVTQSVALKGMSPTWNEAEPVANVSARSITDILTMVGDLADSKISLSPRKEDRTRILIFRQDDTCEYMVASAQIAE